MNVTVISTSSKVMLLCLSVLSWTIVTAAPLNNGAETESPSRKNDLLRKVYEEVVTRNTFDDDSFTWKDDGDGNKKLLVDIVSSGGNVELHLRADLLSTDAVDITG